MGGDTEEFKVMQSEYETMWERLKNVHTNSNGDTYTKETAETPQEFINIINVLTSLNDIEVEICDSWIWVSGNTSVERIKIPIRSQKTGLVLSHRAVQKKEQARINA